MITKQIFVSFDYHSDNDKKGSLIAQSENAASPFTIVDFSLQKAEPDHLWLRKAQSAIDRCDVFVVILGNNTHQAPGVLKEMKIAKDLHKLRFQLKSQGTDPRRVKDAGPVVNWTWPKLQRILSK